MFPFGLAVGFVAGAATAALFAPQLVRQARPAPKVALKTALPAMHEVQVRGAEAVEAAEDLYAEAKSEVNEEIAEASTAEGTPETGDTPQAASEMVKTGQSPSEAA